MDVFEKSTLKKGHIWTFNMSFSLTKYTTAFLGAYRYPKTDPHQHKKPIGWNLKFNSPYTI